MIVTIIMAQIISINSLFPIVTIQKRQHLCSSIRIFSVNPSENTDTPFLFELMNVANTISANNRYFFPGHSGRYVPFDMDKLLDIPELETIASVHSPSGALEQSLMLASELYEAKKTWFLLNGR